MKNTVFFIIVGWNIFIFSVTFITSFFIAQETISVNERTEQRIKDNLELAELGSEYLFYQEKNLTKKLEEQVRIVTKNTQIGPSVIQKKGSGVVVNIEKTTTGQLSRFIYGIENSKPIISIEKFSLSTKKTARKVQIYAEFYFKRQ